MKWALATYIFIFDFSQPRIHLELPSEAYYLPGFYFCPDMKHNIVRE